MGGSTENNGREHREQWEVAQRAMGGSTESSGREHREQWEEHTEGNGETMDSTHFPLTFSLEPAYGMMSQASDLWSRSSTHLILSRKTLPL